MYQSVHKSFNGFKKLSLTLLLVMFSWFVFAGGNNSAGFGTQVKVVKFYPNPATSLINFEFPNNIDKNYSLQVFSFSGKKMAELPVSSAKITLIFNNDFYRGIYVFQLKDKNGHVVDAGKFQVVK